MAEAASQIRFCLLAMQFEVRHTYKFFMVEWVIQIAGFVKELNAQE